MMSFETYLQAQQDAFSAQGGLPSDAPFAMLRGEDADGVLLLHGSAATPCNHRDLARSLYERGYNVFAPLLAGHEHLKALHRGETSWQDCFIKVLADAQAFKPTSRRLHVLGSSYGGTLAYLLGCELSDSLASVIALSAPVIGNDGWEPQDPWGLEVKGAILAADHYLPSLEVPTLIGHAFDDTLVVIQNAYDALRKVSAARKKLIVYCGVAHGLGFAQNTRELAADLDQFMQFTVPPRRVVLQIADQGYQQVALAGSFNNWNAQSHFCKPTAQGWQCTLQLMPGKYTYKLVVDGEHWMLDPDAEVAIAPHGEQNSCFEVKL